MEPSGFDIELTENESKLHGLTKVLMTPDSMTMNGWVANIPENRQMAGDVYIVRRNPHYMVESRPTSANMYSHTFTDLHNASRGVISYHKSLEHETEQLHQDVALIDSIRTRIGTWSSWSESEYVRYSSVLELVTSGHLRDLDPSKQLALEQLIGSAKFTDSLGRLNPSMVSWRLPKAKAQLETRKSVVRKQFSTAYERQRWIDECKYSEKKDIDKLIELTMRHDLLSECQDEFLRLARFIRFKPYVQAVNKAWHNIDQPNSAAALRVSLQVFCELYGALMRSMGIIASVPIKEFAKFEPPEIGSFVLLAESSRDLLQLVGTDEHYRRLASQLMQIVTKVVDCLVSRDFKSARKLAQAYRYTLHYHGQSGFTESDWYLKDGMEWPSLYPPDFDPFKGLP